MPNGDDGLSHYDDRDGGDVGGDGRDGRDNGSHVGQDANGDVGDVESHAGDGDVWHDEPYGAYNTLHNI